MTSPMQQLFIPVFTALMVVIQCVAPLQSACGCAADPVSSADVQTAESPRSCCTEPADLSCCGPTECSCGAKCGSGSTNCECGCNDADDSPNPAQEPEPRSQHDVKVLSRVDTGETVVAQLNAANNAAKSLPRSECSAATRVQALLCTWQT